MKDANLFNSQILPKRKTDVSGDLKLYYGILQSMDNNTTGTNHIRYREKGTALCLALVGPVRLPCTSGESEKLIAYLGCHMGFAL